MPGVLLAQGLVNEQHGACRYATFQELPSELLAVQAGHCNLQFLRELVPVANAIAVGAEAGISGEFRPADDLREFAELMVVADGNEDIARSRLELVAGGEIGMRVAKRDR